MHLQIITLLEERKSLCPRFISLSSFNFGICFLFDITVPMAEMLFSKSFFTGVGLLKKLNSVKKFFQRFWQLQDNFFIYA